MTNLKNQIINTIMKNGKKHTGERILLKLSKSLQRSTRKNSQSIVQLAIVNSTSVFKLNEQIMKKGKRKSKKIIPSFIAKDFLRVMRALKSMRSIVEKTKGSTSFYKKFAGEVLGASFMKGVAVEQKVRIQTQVLLNKRYLAKFRW